MKPLDLTTKSNTFSCCKLSRTCSDAKRCLLDEADPDRAQLCEYREHLQSGEIFFGKNRKDFSSEKYEEVVRIYESLDPANRAVFDDLLLYLIGNHFHLSVRLWFNFPQLEQLAALGLIEVSRYDRLVLNQYLMADLRKASKEKSKKKDDLISLILANEPDVVELLAGSFRYVNLPSALWMYYVELYYDFLCPANRTQYIGRLPFDAQKMQVLEE